MTRRNTQTETGQSRGENDAFSRENYKANATHRKKITSVLLCRFLKAYKNKIYLLRGNFQQIPRSLVVKQMDRESNANSKASVQGTVW